jgi:predicted NAD/FAD-binding protein
MTRKIAIVGTGISGLGAAYALKDTADVTVFESRERAGGHAHTVTVDYEGTSIPVDMGFIVYNGLNYPNLTGFFEALSVKTERSDMSFAVSNPDGFEWASTLKGIFARKQNLFRPRFHRFWRTILEFNDIAREDLETGRVGNETLGVWLDKHGFSEDFRTNYILPMGGAIWSTPPAEMLDYPALSFFRFFDNHRLMHAERPKWRTVTGGSQSYVRAACEVLGDRVRIAQPVEQVSPFDSRIRITSPDGTEMFDDVIVATHSDTAHEILSSSFEDQRFLLNSIRYRPNKIYLHKDPDYMPGRRRAWASWNVMDRYSAKGSICLTYWMNRLQNLPEKFPLFVTLNPSEPPPAEAIFETVTFDHPQFDAAASAACRSLERIQGERGLWFAGAWLGSGFHEDGLKSGLRAALSLGGHVPWSAEGVDLVTSVEQRRRTAETALRAVR